MSSYALIINFSQILLPLYPLSFLPLFILISIIFLYNWLSSPKCNTTLHKPPPGPPKLPIIGNLHQLGKLPHRSLQSLSYKYGNLMLLYFGNRPTLVVASASAAEEIIKSHEIFFLNRPKLRFIDRIFYDANDVGFSKYNEKWRYMKSICVTQLLSNKRVQSFQSIREEEVGRMIEEIKSYGGSVLNLSEIVMKLAKGLICRTALGRTFDDGRDGSGKDIYKLFKELTEVMGEISVGDYIPFLSWIDRLTGLEGRVEYVRKQFDEFIEEVVQEHELRVRPNGNRGYKDDEGQNNVSDFIEVLLEIQRENPAQISRESIKAVILDIFGAGTDTTSTMLGWAMTELIWHPNIMKKLQEEVRGILKSNTRVTEDDLENMKYLKAVIKEILRLHPPVPLSVFRESSQNVKIDKYDIAAKTQIMINTWAMQRDPSFWQDPEVFHPERFLNNTSCADFKGQHFQFVPFGGGRRGCPGLSLATTTVEFVLASLVYEFNWSLPDGKEGNTLDIAESWGISVRRQNPLIVVATLNAPYSRN